MIGPGWLLDDILRVENLLLETARSSQHPLVAEASEHLMKAGGKRLRPALVLLSSRSGEVGRRETDLAAAAVELIHLASLYHDDVIDETETRRGVPTVHSKWGIEIAVLAGDYLFAKGCVLGATAGGDVPLILAGALADVCEGQIVEDNAVNDPKRSVEHYLETISKKTAALFRASCEMGATTAGAPEADRAALSSYGQSLGLVFQMVDDLLDLVGEEKIIGKAPGTDLKEGVFTLPVLIACERERSLVDALAGGERELPSLLPAIEATGAIDETFAMASSAAADARKALDGVGGDGDWLEALDTIVDGVMAQAGRARD